MGQAGRQMVAVKLRQHHCTRSAASAEQSAARRMMAGARRSLRVTRRWRSAGRMPCLHGAGFQAGGGSEAMLASLLTVCCQRSAAERGPPYGGRREAVTACDLLLAKRVAYAQLAWGREAGRWWQRSYYGITAHDLPPAQRRARPCHMTAGARQSLRVTRRWRGAAQV
jgi:hypothetical protein